MEEKEAMDLVKKLVCRGRNLLPEAISGETCLVDDLGFDSLDAAELFVAFQQETGREVDVTNLSDVRTVGELAAAVVASGR